MPADVFGAAGEGAVRIDPDSRMRRAREAPELFGFIKKADCAFVMTHVEGFAHGQHLHRSHRCLEAFDAADAAPRAARHGAAPAFELPEGFR